jgi:hypothetical protein
MHGKVPFAAAVTHRIIRTEYRRIALDDHLDQLPDESRAKCEAVLVGALSQQVDSVVDHGAADEVARPSCGGSAGARRVGEGVNVYEPGRPHDFQRPLELGVTFAGESHNNVSRHGGAVERLIHPLDGVQEIAARVLAIHPSENRIRSTLERQMKVGDDLPIRSKGIKQVVSKIFRLEA